MQSEEETSKRSFWGNADAIDSQLGSLLNRKPILSEPVEGSCLTRAMSGCSDGCVSLSDLKFDGISADYSEVAMLDFQDGHLMGEMEQESGPASSGIVISPSCCTASSNWSETLRRSSVRKLSPATLNSGCAGDTGYDGACSNQSSPNKIQRRSLPPSINFSSPSACERQNVFDSAEANLFGPFASALPSSLEPLFVDMSWLTSFDIRSPMLAEDLSRTNPGVGIRLSSLGSMDVHQPPLQDCVHPEIDWAPLGEVIKSEAPTTASIRLARKKRIHRNKKAVSSTNCVGRPAPSLELPVQITGGRRQGAKDRTGAKYLLEKQLRASDVGRLSRIILPKKDAETHLPSLAHGDGIPFDCEDFITEEIMEFRFRFWPNNKSRMYVLENTGEFIRRHQLREDDSIAMYRDEEDGTYLLRPRKAGDGQELRTRAVARFGRKGKEIRQASSSGGLARRTPSSFDGSVSETSVLSEITIAGKLKAAFQEPVEMYDVSTILPAQDVSLTIVQSADLPGAHVKNGMDTLSSLVESSDVHDAVDRNCTDTISTFPSLEAFDAEVFS